MHIKDVCRKCGLTKKAVEYYEKQGLIAPGVEGNGYRNYLDADVSALKEIAVLRSLGLGVADIREVLKSANKASALLRCREQMELEREKQTVQLSAMELLMEEYEPDRAQAYIKVHLNPSLSVREKLLQAFPGAYGVYLSLHFGRFLNEPLNTQEKEEAYRKVLAYLDDAPALPDELVTLLEQSIPATDKAMLETLDTGTMEALQDTQAYLEQNRDVLESYLEWRGSEEYRASSAYRLRELLLAYQNDTGYQEQFLHHLRIISPAYCAYVQRLEQANGVFLAQYPQAETLLK